MPNMRPESKYIAAADLRGQDQALVIERVQQEEVGNPKEWLWVVYFQRAKKGLVLNVTNQNSICDQHGDNSEAWIGRVITLYPTETTYESKMVPCVRIRAAILPQGMTTAGAAAPPIPAGPTVPDEAPLDDEIPF